MPAGSQIDLVHGAERGVLWVHESARLPSDVPALEWEAEQWSLLENGGDDIFLFDQTGALVAYMAWGSGSDVLYPPTVFGVDVWDDSEQGQLDGSGEGRSISRASHLPESLTLSQCWEYTGTGTSKEAGTCAGARTTKDKDNFSNCLLYTSDAADE